MDPEMRNLLLRIAENTEENNVLLKKMHRSIIWGRVFKLIYWLIVVGLAVGAFYFIQPYVNSLMSAMSSINDTVGKGQDFLNGNARAFLDIFSKFK